MTQEEKAREYDIIIKRVTWLYEAGTTLTREQMEYLFPELRESENERIRHALIEFLREAYSRGNAPEECAKWIVWLDQPKKQKSASISCSHENDTEWSEEDKAILGLIQDAVDRFGFDNAQTYYAVSDFLKSLRPSWKPSEQKEQKQNKWSKKDKKILQSLHHVMNCADAQNVVKRDGLSVEDVCTFLFSIEPNWKPSEEQMCYLKKVCESYDFCDGERDALESLYNDLLKKQGVKEEPEYYQHFDPDC